jgi:hypothetical protein
MKMHWKKLVGMLLLAMLVSTQNTWGGVSASDGCITLLPGQKPPPNLRLNCVPEIDATGTLPALALLGGVVALVRERKRRK